MSKKFMQQTRLALLSFGFLFLAFGSLSQSPWLLWLAAFCSVAFVMLVLSKPELPPIKEPTEYEADWNHKSRVKRWMERGFDQQQATELASYEELSDEEHQRCLSMVDSTQDKC